MENPLTFSAGDVARAAQIDADTLQNFLKRHPIFKNSYEGGGARGRHKRYSWHAMMHVTAASALIAAGLAAGRAFEAAAKFAHFGELSIGGEVTRRRPGLPYHWSHGKSLLVVTPDHAEVIHTGDPNKLPLHLIRGAPPSRFPLAFTLLDVSTLFERVCREFGFNDAEMLNDAYHYNQRQANVQDHLRR